MHYIAPKTIFFVYFLWYVTISWSLPVIVSWFLFFFVDEDLFLSSWANLLLEILFLGVDIPEISSLLLFLLWLIFWKVNTGYWIDPWIFYLDLLCFKLFWDFDFDLCLLALFFGTKCIGASLCYYDYLLLLRYNYRARSPYFYKYSLFFMILIIKCNIMHKLEFYIIYSYFYTTIF